MLVKSRKPLISDAKKPRVVGFLLGGIALNEGMHLNQIKNVLAIIEKMPDYSDPAASNLVRPMVLLMNTDNLDKSSTEAQQLQFWNRVLAKGKPAIELTQVPNFSTLAGMLLGSFNVSDFQGKQEISLNHRNLRDIHYILSPKQVANYRQNPETRAVETQVIGEFCQSLTRLSDTPNKAFSDFNRSTALLGYPTQGKSDREISAAIDTFVAGNKSKSQYSEIDKKLVTYLRHNGGQELNRCFELEMINKLTLKHDDQMLTFGYSSGTQVWRKDASGTIFCDMIQEIYSLKQGITATICLDSNQKILVLEDPQEADIHVGKNVALRSPILKGEFRVRLEFNSATGQIEPAVEFMRVSAQNATLLTHPYFVPVAAPKEEMKKVVTEEEVTTTPVATLS